MIGDIGVVSTALISDEVETSTVKHPTIVGVPELETYKACLKCKARVESRSPGIGSCSNSSCRMMQKYDICPDHTSARLLIMYENGRQERKMMQVSVLSEQMLQKWIGKEIPITQEALISSRPVSAISVNEKRKVVTDIH